MNEQALRDLVEQIKLKQARCKQAIDSPGVSDLIKQRVLITEYNTYVLALQGAREYLPPQQNDGKPNSSDMVPATTAGHQTP